MYVLQLCVEVIQLILKTLGQLLILFVCMLCVYIYIYILYIHTLHAYMHTYIQYMSSWVWLVRSSSSYSKDVPLGTLSLWVHRYTLTSVACKKKSYLLIIRCSFLPLFQAFAEVTFHCLKVRAHHKLLLHAALYTSIYSFIFSPVLQHAGWKMGKSVSAAEEAKRVLPQSVTNASLDTWWGHSSLLSLGDNMPLRHLLLTHLHMHAFHTLIQQTQHAAHLHVCTKVHGHTITPSFSTADTATCSVSLAFSNSCFWISASTEIARNNNYLACKR